MRRGWLLAVGALTLGAVSFVWWARAESGHEVMSVSSPSEEAQAAPPAVMPAAEAVPRAATPTTTPSLTQTEPDGEIEVDSAGHLKVTRALRRRFDYWLTAAGELTPPAIRDAVVESTPTEPLRGEVLAVYDRYAAYLLAVSALHPVDPSARERVRLLKALRREKLGEELTAIFFAEEESLDDEAVVRLEALHDPTLLPEQRVAKSLQLELAKANVDVRLLRQQNEQFVRDGVTPGDRFKEREAAFGTEAAKRLAALDEERARWNARVSAFRAQSARIDQDASLTGPAKVAAKRRILETSFSENERPRVSP